MATLTEITRRARLRKMLNKVPEITLYFWVVKILCTTVGETAADFLNTNLNFGLTNTTYVTGIVLLIILGVQFRLKRYVAGIYWLAVVLLSVFGTLITDNLTDNLGVSLVTTTTIFSIVLAGVFFAWYKTEKTLSIHSIFTTVRELFYWLTILFTFALGTAAGDLVAEKLNLGYLISAFIFGGIIAVIAIMHSQRKINGVLAFWLAYILTRPLGASIGDFLSQPRDSGGLGLGMTVTSIIFLTTIAGVVIYLTRSKHDQITLEHISDATD